MVRCPRGPVPALPFYQLDAQFLFQLAQAGADGGLRGIHRLRRPGNGLVADNIQEGADVLQVTARAGNLSLGIGRVILQAVNDRAVLLLISGDRDGVLRITIAQLPYISVGDVSVCILVRVGQHHFTHVIL